MKAERSGWSERATAIRRMPKRWARSNASEVGAETETSVPAPKIATLATISNEQRLVMIKKPLSGATPAEAVSWGKVNPGVLPDTVVAYCDSTIAFPLFCEYAIGSTYGRRPLKRLVHKRAALLADLKKQATAARKTAAETVK